MATILVIEDDDIMLKAIKHILMKNGYDVITAKDGKEASTKIETEKYNIVLTDLMMPYANGLELVQKVASDPDKRHVSIIVVSSIGNEETITEAFRLGASDFIKKPIMANELLMRIKRLLDKSTEQKLVTKKK